jgi:hypothetical protein
VAKNVIGVSTNVRQPIANVSHNPIANRVFIAVSGDRHCEPLQLAENLNGCRFRKCRAATWTAISGRFFRFELFLHFSQAEGFPTPLGGPIFMLALRGDPSSYGCVGKDVISDRQVSTRAGRSIPFGGGLVLTKSAIRAGPSSRSVPHQSLPF